MKIALIGVLAALLPGALQAQSAGAAAAATTQITAKAKDLIAALSQEQRGRFLFAFTDDVQRVRWSNLPTSAVPRAGLRLGDLTAPQRSAAMNLLAAAYSRMGYEKILAIMEGDEVLKTQQSASGGGGKGKGKGGLMFGRDEYYISILGTPSVTEPWMLQFGGHHLAVNLTIAGAQGALTPTLTAAQPATYTVEGKTVRPLGAENDKAFALINALDEGQRKQAVLNYAVRDLVLGPGQDGKSIQPEGIKGSALNAKQQAMLWDLASEWTGIVHDAAASARMAEIKAAIADTWFAWSGDTKPGSPAYFRIQGPKLVIEYAPQAMGGDPLLHIHTIYRDPTNDYGRKPARP
jgi:hypothetical protein